jgi:DNA ligase-1
VLFETLANTSRAVSETRSRLSKTAELARCLAELAPEEVEPAIMFLCGEPRQGKIGVGYATLRDLGRPAAASRASLAVLEVDAALDRLQRTTGGGAGAERRRQLEQLLSRATAEEQGFIVKLLTGELRQGALA